MKVIYLLLLLLLGLLSAQVKAQSVLYDDSLFTRELMKSAIGKKCNLAQLLEDDRTILRDNATRFMRNLYSISDSFDIYYEFMTVSDTIGIAHELSVGTGKIICVKHFSSGQESYLIFDVSDEGEIRNVEKFTHGNYECCWQSIRDGFQKIGDFFAFKSCSTGSGLCGSNFYLFTELSEQNELFEIPYEGSLYIESDRYYILEVSIALSENKLILHYKKNEMRLKGKKVKAKFQTLKESTAEYVIENGKFKLVSGETITLLD